MQQVVFARGGELRDRAHGPQVVADVVAIAVVEPIGVCIIQPAAGDPAVIVGKICRVIERSECILACLKVAGLLIIHRVDRAPTRGIAGQARARTAAGILRRRSLLIDRPGALVRPAAEFVPHPVEQVAHVAAPMRIDRGRVWRRKDVVCRHRRQRLVQVLRVFRHVLEVPAPAVVFHRIFHDPVPGGPAGLVVFAKIALFQPNELSEKPHRRDNHAAVLFFVDDVSRSGVEPKGPRRVRLVSRSNVGGQRIRAGDARVEVLAIARQLVEQHVPDAQLADLVGFNSAKKRRRHSADGAAIFRIVLRRRRKGHLRPCPVGRRGAVGELVIEHRSHHRDGLLIPRIRIPGNDRIHELPEGAGRVSLPVGPLAGLGVEDRVDQIDLQPAFGVGRNSMLHEIPRQPKHLVIPLVFLRVIPGQQFPL